MGRLAAQPGVFAQLGIDSNDPVKLPKAGVAHHLGIRVSQFRNILSIKAKHISHPGALEAAAISLALRWLLRSPRKHATRVPLLCDAQAVLHAAVKGRSSAPTFRYELRRIAALSLAGDILVRYIYVPSACNPADAPSRGLQRRAASKARL